MKKEFENYMNAISATNTAMSRVDEILEHCERLTGIDPNSIFVSESVDGEGARQFEGLWLLSQDYVMEAKSFIDTNDLDMAPLRSGFTWLNVIFKEFSEGQSLPSSRIVVEGKLDSGINLEIKASGKNCEFLWDLAKSYFVPKTK